MRNRPTPPGVVCGPRAAATSLRLQTAGRPRTLRTRPKLPPARCRHHTEFGKLSPSPGRRVSGASAAVPPAQRIAAGVPPAGEAQRGPAVCAGARAQRGRRLGGERAGAARRRRKPFQRRPPRLHGAGRARRLRHVFPRADADRIRSRNVSAPSALAVASGLGVAAVAYSSEDVRPPAPVERWAAGRASRSPGKRSKSPSDRWATWRGGDRAARRAWNGTTARLRLAGALKAICGQCQRLPTRIAASS